MLEKLPLAHSSHCAQPNPSEIDPGWQYWHGSSPCQNLPLRDVSPPTAPVSPPTRLPTKIPTQRHRNFDKLWHLRDLIGVEGSRLAKLAAASLNLVRSSDPCGLDLHHTADTTNSLRFAP